MSPRPFTSVDQLATWPVDHAATAIVSADGSVLATAGDVDRRFRLASVTKLLSAYATLIAVEEGVFDLDTPAGPPGSTVRHLLAHASGLDFSEDRVRAAPGTRRIYSNRGFDVLAAALADHSGIDFGTYLDEAVLQPLGMASTTLDGSAAAGAVSTVRDLTAFAAEVQKPRLVSDETLANATTVTFPGLDGVLAGYGTQRPNDWGLGFEVRDGKSPHWTGSKNSPASFGHFGQSGTFVWVDPVAGAACVALTDRDFGAWAIEAWPPFSDQVLADLGR